jgi:hypothetical protein
VPTASRPVFLKIAYHGPEAMEQLVEYDPHLVPGILGGSSGTTHDAFKLLEEARKHGARAALFGRKINNSEHQLTFVTYLHAIANGKIAAQEAVRAYHGELQKLQIKPYRDLKADMELTTTATSYAGAGSSASLSKPKAAVIAAPTAFGSTTPNALPVTSDGAPDFKKMTSAQKVAFARQRIKTDLTRAKDTGAARR